MMEYINEIHHCVTQGGNIPIIMYYPVNRAINNAPAHLKRGGKEPEIWDTYENALKGNTEFRSFLNGTENKKITRMNTYVTTEVIRTKNFLQSEKPSKDFSLISVIFVFVVILKDMLFKKILKSLNSTNYHKEKNVIWL